jgi:hypothetical protein
MLFYTMLFRCIPSPPLRYLEQRTSRAVMEATFRRVDDLLAKTMIAAESEMTPRVFSDCQFRSNCFELFGVDVMLDAKLQPHLIEVNISPSLMGSSPLDRQIKGLLVADMFHLVGFYPHDARMLSKFGGQVCCCPMLCYAMLCYAVLSYAMLSR